MCRVILRTSCSSLLPGEPFAQEKCTSDRGGHGREEGEDGGIGQGKVLEGIVDPEESEEPWGIKILTERVIPVKTGGRTP